MNIVGFTGNICKNLELRQAGDTCVTELNVAINKKVKKGDEYVDKTVFVQVTVWGKQAEACVKYLKKGSKVAIAGELDFDSWEKDGQKRSKLFVKAHMFGGVEFLTPKGDQESQQDQQPAVGSGEEYAQSQPADPKEEVGDLPPF